MANAASALGNLPVAAITGELAAFARSADAGGHDPASQTRLANLLERARSAIADLGAAGLEPATLLPPLPKLLNDLAAGVNAAEAPTIANLEARSARLDSGRWRHC